MSEIEKMYRRCKIKRQQTCRSSDTCYNGSLNKCEGCNSYQFPPFTPEKQIEILKLLCQRRFIEFGTTPDNEYFLYDHDCCQTHSKHFEEAVSEFVCTLWQDLTPEEKQQVKGILE